MGINFLYIGRDEATLKDKLLIEPSFDIGLPDELAGLAPSTPSPVTSNSSSNTAGPSALSSLFAAFDISSLIPTVPRGFNFSSPYVVAPFDPISMRGPNMSSSTATPTPSSVSSVPAGGSSALFDSMIGMVEGMLKSFFPDAAKDFKVSKLFSQGGIVTSEMEGLIRAISKTLGFKDPFEEISEGHHARVVGDMVQRLMWA
jgi:hypothetical protein